MLSRVKTQNYNQTTGFSLIELLVVITVIGILASLVYVHFTNSRQSTQDKIRQTTLLELQLAIEQYRAERGRYPSYPTDLDNPSLPSPLCPTAGPDVWITNGLNRSGVTPVARCPIFEFTPFIFRLSPEYIPTLPNPALATGNYYFYRTNADQSAYKLMAFRAVQQSNNFVTGPDEPFSDCPSQCVGEPCNARAAHSPWTYAVYSSGAECW